MEERAQFEQNIPNMEFQVRLYHEVQQQVRDIPGIRILDFGAGIKSHAGLIYGGLRPDQSPIVAYDPHVKPIEYPKIRWTNEMPSGNFDLILCHFSLHHLDQTPVESVRDFDAHNPKVISIAEYDYQTATIEAFKASFGLNANELDELATQFNGDMEACFAYHRKFGKDDYRKALTENGYTVQAEAQGEESAGNKFYFVGKK